ncbi:MAG TPA: oligosaccharide flippase family protein [Baekduia sp.]|nr:oligosaccharide flippase family protein [Baekduia sp.]
MLKRLLTALRHPVSRNVMALYWVQIATFVVPLVTLPYVARVLEPSAFGLVVFAQGFAFLLVILINWGLGLTGVRSTAANQNDPEVLAEVVRGVRGGQLVLAAASAVIAAGALVLVPTMTDHPEFLVMAWVAAATLGVAPNWFFLGIEQARVTALIQLGFRAAGAALTFVLVKDPDDAWIVMALFAGSSVGALVVSDVMMYRRVAFRLPRWRLSVGEIRGGTMIFVGTLGVSLVTSINVVLLGFFESSAGVAHFGAAERLVRTSITLLGPIGAAVIPRMTALQAAGERERARRLLTIAVAAGALPAVAIMLILIVFASPILHVVYGEDFVDTSVPILRVMALIIPVNVVGAVFGVWLMSLRKDGLIVTIALAAGISNVVFGCTLTLLFGPIGMAWSVIAAEAVGAAGGVIAVRHNARRAAVAGGTGSAPLILDPDESRA